MNLYKVELQTSRLGEFYVVARDPTSAYERVLRDQRDRDRGSDTDRALKSIILVAEDEPYPETARLYISEQPEYS